MGLRPVQDLTGFIPVIHFLEGNILQRCSGNDQSIEFTIPDLIKGSVKFVQMARRGIQ